MPWLTHCCQLCAVPLAAQSQSAYCGACLQQPPIFHQAHALFLYSTPVNRLIWDLKFRHRLAVAQVLGYLLAEQMAVYYAQQTCYPDVLIPVPLHRNRLRERGFNQALELARPISKQLKIPLDFTVCKRIRETATQTGLSAKERAKNVKHAFTLQKQLKAQHVCLIDDVMTTGHTIAALSHSLQRQGTTRIDVWCSARSAVDSR